MMGRIYRGPCPVRDCSLALVQCDGVHESPICPLHGPPTPTPTMPPDRKFTVTLDWHGVVVTWQNPDGPDARDAAYLSDGTISAQVLTALLTALTEGQR